MTNKPKILIYDNDPESTGPVSVAELYTSLLAVVDSQYHIERVNSACLNYQDWSLNTALLVIPGGRAKPHYLNLAAGGNQKIIDYVQAGGQYLGLCAGGYYGAAQTVFERGGDLEVYDTGPLNFYSGIAEGPAYGLGKFQYQKETGAALATICFENSENDLRSLQVYFNGGCFFHGHNDQNVKILARYQDIKDQPIAIVECRVGAGKAILSGVHFEYSHPYLEQTSRLQFFAGIMKRLLDPANESRDNAWRF